MENDINKAYELINEASKITVLTGAGISSESGIPTFRGDGGLWNNYRPEGLQHPKLFLKTQNCVGVVRLAKICDEKGRSQSRPLCS